MEQIDLDDLATGCDARDYTKFSLGSKSIQSKFVLLKRGLCSFYEKAALADQFGAAGMFIVGTGFDAPHKTTIMTSATEEDVHKIGIVSLMVSLDDSNVLIQQINKRSEEDRFSGYDTRDDCRGVRFCLVTSMIGDSK